MIGLKVLDLFFSSWAVVVFSLRRAGGGYCIWVPALLSLEYREPLKTNSGRHARNTPKKTSDARLSGLNQSKKGFRVLGFRVNPKP